MSAHEKRAVVRIQPFVVRCRLHHGTHVQPAYLVDLSAKGARLSCDGEPPPIGAAVEIEVRFRGHHGPCRLPAEVKWLAEPGRNDARGLGVRFTGTTRAVRDVVEGVMAEFRDKASRLG
jgi:hypothetical protein